MSDEKPRKKLTIVRKVAPVTNTPEPESIPVLQRPSKRVLGKADLEAIKPTGVLTSYSAKKPPKPKPYKPVQAKPKPKQVVPKKPKKPIRSPSDLRAKELDASLNAFPVWRERKPLAVRFEKQVFQHIAKNSLSASKRVVLKLLEWHVANRFYLQAVGAGGKRFNLDGSEAGDIQDYQIAHALNKLAKRSK